MSFRIKITTLVLLVVIAAAGCKSDKKSEEKKTETDEVTEVPKAPPAVKPNFSGDSAYNYVQKQVDFGPRVPGTKAHAQCAQFLYSELKRFADNVIIQQGQATTFDNKTITIKNIIGEFNPDAARRILLFAHWDTRPFADEDTKDKDKPILGANDGGSGVGVLLEIARQLSIKKPDWGVDIIFFDAEDWGNSTVEDSYCLGSQFWGKNPHKEGYTADYGILLDMVGAPDATFLMEGISKQIAPQILDKVWTTANSLGYYGKFLYREHGGVTDDHYYVYKYTKIPSIDIIHITPGGSFGDFWHTHNDNMSVIDKSTLQAVGETLLKVIYSEK